MGGYIGFGVGVMEERWERCWRRSNCEMNRWFRVEVLFSIGTGLEGIHYFEIKD